ncbi:MAG: pyridoxamine 5'-phosphate oxidase family protein [Candidatus Dormibacteraeota bacterium]|nr:pyridoxamine 5'-phosphate oxidase family protein [Candidatus Dormibacteraeota bacterium]
MPRPMTRGERERFLADLHVGVLSVEDEDGRAPHTLPVWYAYEPGGEITFITGKPTRKVRLMERAGRVSFCVQNEQQPYRYVSVEGPVVGSHHSTEEERRDMAARYLGPEGAQAYLQATPELAEIEWTYRVRPERWLTQDFSDMG